MRKVVVHSYSRGNYIHYEVITGLNPFGPRGGLNGKFVDGEVRGHFWNREKAEEFAKNLALEEGIVYLTTYDPEHQNLFLPCKPETIFDVNLIIDNRKRQVQLAHVRKGQKAFRNKIIEAFGGKCAITGCDIPQVLQACHIYPYLGEATNHPSNGLLLRSDLHELFDSLLLTVSSKGRLMLSLALEKSTYSKYENIKLRMQKDNHHDVSKSAMKLHRDQYKSCEKFRKK